MTRVSSELWSCGSQTRLRDSEPPDRDLAGSSIGLSIERNFLARLQGNDTRALKRGGVHKYISAAIVRLNEAETFLAVVELHCAVRHDDVPFSDGVHMEPSARFRGQFAVARIWREAETCARQCEA